MAQGLDLLWQFLTARRMVDWEVFQVAVALLWAGKSPYFGTGQQAFYNPAWTAVILSPLVWLPVTWQPLAVALASLAAVALVARQLRIGTIGTFLTLSAPALWYTIGYGNIDALVWFGLVVPAPIGLLFLAMKPQMTLWVMAVVVARQGTWGSRAAAIVPLLVIGGASVALYGWRLPAPSRLTVEWWPYGLALGIPMGLWAVWKRSVRAAILAMPLCTPYLSWSSYLGLSFVNPLMGWLAQAYMLTEMMVRSRLVSW